MARPDSPADHRAVVLGASLAGLLAARVLSEHHAEVVLLERDELPTGAAPRKGTPHAVQPHGLLARGRLVLEELFPGFTAALVAQGALLGDLQAEVRFEVNRQAFASGSAGVQALAASRLAIEAEVRRRVLALPGVRAITNVDVLAPLHEGGVVRAARWRERDGGGAERQLPAALVVDCTGRGSHLPQWLRSWGLQAPAEERVQVGICYASALFRRSGRCAHGEPGMEHVALFGPVTNEQPRPGVLIAQEPGEDGVPRWVAGIGGYAGDHPSGTLENLRERARDLASPGLIKVVHEAELIGEVMRYQFPHSQRRRYERLATFPEGLLAMGDALTSFNPIYGQGMTVAACEALALRRELARGTQGLARRFFRAAAREIDVPWQLAVGGDLSLDSVPGPRPLPVRIVNAYIARLFRVAPHDAVVSNAFQRVVHMLDRPERLFAPRVLWRVLLKAGAATARRDSPAPHSGSAAGLRGASGRS
jgi:2-polyprenyl-6-methoxyphenol hydroxylase-like FAD-dependent oxidoreductase